jgi:predicted nuclease of predicted toxin-antitoxin system
VKFLVDAQLPRRLARELVDLGHDAIHTLDLPDKNATPDGEIMSVADREDRIVVTKDGDFRTRHLISGVPRKLLHVTTGNMTNDALLDTFRVHLAEIEAAFEESGHVELTEDAVISHPRRDT